MENLEIKTEYDISNDVLYIKEEEIDSENVNIDDIKDEELLEIKREEECEDEVVDSQFEAIFLPEIYNGVIVETPFFDFNLYRKRYGLPTEDDEINRSYSDMYFNRKNLENNVYKNLELGYDRQGSENEHDSCIPAYSLSPVDLDSTENSCTVSHSVDEQYHDKMPSESNQPTNENVFHSENGFVQAYIKACVDKKQKTKAYHRKKYVNNNRFQQDNQIEDQPQRVSDSEYTSQNENRHSQMVPWEPTVSSYAKTSPVNPISERKKHKVKNDDAKFKCPVCKRPRVFNTLLAINNHLKFEHLSLFSNGNEELLQEIMLKAKDVQLVEEILVID